MEKYRFLILGAGPSGLAFAHTLLDHGESSFLVLEKEHKPGGLCRSEMVDGYPLDTGGGHFLDMRIPRVMDFLFRFLPKDQWNEFERRSAIDFGKYMVDYPIESNIWQLPVEVQVNYIMAIAYAGENTGIPAPRQFEEWIRWKLGSRIAEDYMFPYNRKIWSIELAELGTYWIDKLPSVSFQEVLTSCLTRKPYGKIPAHRTFLYPANHGYGEVWERMGKELGNKLLLSTLVTSLDVKNRTVNGNLTADYIISTIPPGSVETSGIPGEVKHAVAGLKHASIQIDYFPGNLNNRNHWIYVPDAQISYHRILNRMTFASGSRGYWTETNAKRAVQAPSTIAMNEFAYPLNTREKPVLMEKIRTCFAASNVIGLGRWGTWEHINSDIAVNQAIELAETLLK